MRADTLPRMADKEPRTAGDTMSGLIVIGILFLIAGGIMIGLAWPGETTATSPYSGREVAGAVKESGSAAAAAIGCIVAGVGGLLLNVGLIAWAVSLGVRRADAR